MKKVVSLLVLMFLSVYTISAQIRFSANANVYNNNTNQKVGTQYIAADINSEGMGTMTLGSIKMSARVTNTQRDNRNRMTAYSVSLSSRNGKSVKVVITKRDKGTYSVVVYYADGTLRYDF